MQDGGWFHASRGGLARVQVGSRAGGGDNISVKDIAYSLAYLDHFVEYC